MTIIHLTYSMDYGGIETMLINIMNEQVKHAKVILLTINNSYEEVLINSLDSKIEFINIGRKIGSKNPWSILKLNKLLLRLRPDVIHVHHSGIIRFLISALFKRRMVLTMHDIPTAKDYKNLSKYKCIYSISHSVSKALSSHCISSNIVLNGIKPETFLSKEKQSIPEVFRILCVSRLVLKKKGQDILINACSILINKGLNKIHIDFIGEGESELDLKEMVKKLGLESYITFLGKRSPRYIEQHLCNYNLFVQPSRREGFGLTVAEAMAAKVPVLVSNQEGPKEIIADGKYGFMFDTDNSTDCALQIEKIIKMPIYSLKKMTENAWKHIVENYDIRKTANHYIEEYNKLSD